MLLLEERDPPITAPVDLAGWSSRKAFLTLIAPTPWVRVWWRGNLKWLEVKLRWGKRDAAKGSSVFEMRPADKIL